MLDYKIAHSINKGYIKYHLLKSQNFKEIIKELDQAPSFYLPFNRLTGRMVKLISNTFDDESAYAVATYKPNNDIYYNNEFFDNLLVKYDKVINKLVNIIYYELSQFYPTNPQIYISTKNELNFKQQDILNRYFGIYNNQLSLSQFEIPIGNRYERPANGGIYTSAIFCNKYIFYEYILNTKILRENSISLYRYYCNINFNNYNIYSINTYQDWERLCMRFPYKSSKFYDDHSLDVVKVRKVYDGIYLSILGYLLSTHYNTYLYSDSTTFDYYKQLYLSRLRNESTHKYGNRYMNNKLYFNRDFYYNWGYFGFNILWLNYPKELSNPYKIEPIFDYEERYPFLERNEIKNDINNKESMYEPV